MRRAAVMLASVVVLGACASATPGEDAANLVDVEVINDIMPPTPMTVYVMHERGRRTLLGMAAASDTARFNFHALGGSYRLIAESRVSRAEYSSQPFTPISPERFAWRLRANLVVPVEMVGP